VIAEECTGCDLCVEPCPVDCIDMIAVETTSKTWVWELPTINSIHVIASDKHQRTGEAA
jgi:electron transport complex protein RnfB